MARSQVTVAAGAVVLHKSGGGWRVLLVHRPKYDDWSLPKGKLERGEDPATAAVREVEEETGVQVRLARVLPDQRYAVGSGEKLVHYWTARPVGRHDVTGYEPNREIDDVRWVPVDRAAEKLTYDRDRETLAVAVKRRRRTSRVLVLRHAEARGRKAWHHDDRLRPLLAPGVVRAEQLADVLAAHGVDRVVSSSSTRCVQTLTPYAARSGREVECRHHLSEEDATPDRVRLLVEELVAAGEDVVVCSHRPVLPWLLEALGAEPVRLDPGAMVVVHLRRGSVVSVEAQPVG